MADREMNENNGGEGREQQQQGPEDIAIMNEEEPAFLEPDEAVEVVVDDENVPMDDADDEDDDNDEPEGTNEIVDSSKFKTDCHSGPIYALASYLDESMNLTAVSGGGDDRAFLHKFSKDGSQSSTQLSHEHTDSVSCVALNHEYVSDDLVKTPRFCAVGGYDGAIVVYDPVSGEKLKEFEGPSDVEWLCFHPKGGIVLLAGSMEDCTVWMYHVLTSKCLQVFVGHENGVCAGAFTPDGRWALSASADGTLRVWAPRTGKNKHIFRVSESGAGLTSVATGGGTDGQLVVVGAEDGKAHVCHIPSKKVISSLQHYDMPAEGVSDGVELPMSVEAVGFATTNPNWCATGGMNGKIKVWDLSNSGQCRLEIGSSENADEDPAGITRLKWHPQEPIIIASSADGNVRVWDARNGGLMTQLSGNADVVNDMDVAFGSAGAAVVTGGEDAVLRVFEI